MPACHETKIPRNRRSALCLLLLGCLLLGACQPEDRSAEETASADTYFPIRFGEATLKLQLALTTAEQQRGLMFRESLEEDHGMLFLFERPKKQGFWMQNTQLPLDIGYLDASGKLLEVHKLFPFDETPVASRSTDILIAVETNRGWYAENGISPGAQLDMEALKEAITRRGFPVAKYAIED